MEEILSDFDNVQWCQDILNDSSLELLRTAGRLPPPPLDKMIPNTLFNETLRTDQTVRAWVALASLEKRPENASPDFILLLSLGTGLGGFKDYAHGGFSGLIFDQAMAVCASMALGSAVRTIEMWQNFKKPIKIPGIIQCKVVVTKVVDRRAYIRSTIEDGAGTVYCEGGSIFLLPKDQNKARI